MIMIPVLAGLTAGAAHVIAGPDHLAALAPIALDRPKLAAQVGIKWGVGHGLGVLLLGGLGIATQQAIDVTWVSAWSEFVVGFMLIIVGFWAFNRTSRFVIHTHSHEHMTIDDDDLENPEHAVVSHNAHFDDHTRSTHHHVHIHPHGIEEHTHEQHNQHSHAALFVGFLHGTAGTGHLFGVLPSLALSTFDAILYLTTYLVSAVISMGLFGLLLGSLSKDRGPQFIRKLMYTVSSVVIIIGVFWVFNAWPALTL